MGLLYEEKVPSNRTEFVAKVKDISSKLSIEPNWLMAIMWSESKFSPSVSNIQCVKDTGNASSCATGLIQFMPSTAQGLGTNIDSLKNMSNVQQLDYVYKYFYPYRNRITKFSDLYLVNFYPYAIGKPDTYVFGSERSEELAKKIARQNSGMDINKDGKVTMADYKQWLAQKHPELIVGDEKGKPIIEQEVSTTVKAEKYAKRNWLLIGVIMILIGLSIIFFYKYSQKTKK